MPKKNVVPAGKMEIKQIPIEWYVPEGAVTPYATNIVVQFMEYEFRLMFFESKAPLQIDGGTPLPDRIRADCVASVIISPERMPKLIKLLQEQYDRFSPVIEKERQG